MEVDYKGFVYSYCQIHDHSWIAVVESEDGNVLFEEGDCDDRLVKKAAENFIDNYLKEGKRK